MSKKPVITYDYDPDTSSIEFFINLKLVVIWDCQCDPEECAREFARVFDLGARWGLKSVTKGGK